MVQNTSYRTLHLDDLYVDKGVYLEIIYQRIPYCSSSKINRGIVRAKREEQ